MDTTAGLEPQRAALEAGQEGRFVLSVRNDSEIVEEYAFRVVGDLAESSTVEPPHVSVFPGQSATAIVALTAPRTSAVTAGEHPLGVHVRPVKRPENAAVPEGVVEVLPFFDTVADLSPQSTKGRRGGVYRLVVDNRGNAPVAVALTAKSASDGLELALDETEQTMEPGTTWTSQIRAQPAKRIWRGAPAAHPFTVMVAPAEGAAIALAGTQQQTPVLPAWTFKSLMGVLVVALGAVGLFFSSVGAQWCGALADPEPPALCRDRIAASTTRDDETETGGGRETEPGAQPEVEPEDDPVAQPEVEPETEPGAQPEVEPDTEPEAGVEPEAEPEAVPEAEAEAEAETEAPPEAGAEAAPESPPVPPEPVPVFPALFPVVAGPGEFSDPSRPWPTEKATGPFTVTDLQVGVTTGDTGTFYLLVIDPDGDIALWLRQPLAEIDPGERLVVEGAEAQQDVEGGGSENLQEDPDLQDAVDQMTDQLTDVPGDADGTDGGATDESVQLPVPAPPFTVQPEQKLLLFVRCETPGNEERGVCYESVNLNGAHGEA